MCTLPTTPGNWPLAGFHVWCLCDSFSDSDPWHIYLPKEVGRKCGEPESGRPVGRNSKKFPKKELAFWHFDFLCLK